MREAIELAMSVFNWLRPAALAATIIAASNLLAPAPVQAQGITVLRGSTPQRYSPIDCNNPDYARYCQDNQPSSYSAYSDENDYPYYGDDFPLAVGVGHRFVHRGSFHDGRVRGGVFHGGGFHGVGFHGGGGHR